MPARVPAGWKVLTTPHFGLAYPPDWALADTTNAQDYTGTSTPDYRIESPDHQVWLAVSASPSSEPPNVAHAQFCRPTPVGTPITLEFQPTTLAGLPMEYRLFPYPNGSGMSRVWEFWNAQYTTFSL
jgi:hypothetical protein